MHRGALPGWAFIIYFIYNNVPDQKARFDFWLGALPKFTGILGLMVTAFQSPELGYAALFLGLGYLALVGERKATVRHPALQYIGWGFVLALVVSIAAVVEAGMVVTDIRGTERHLSPAQIDTITREARALAPSYKNDKGPLALLVFAVDTPEADGYAIEIMRAFQIGGIGTTTSLPGATAPNVLRALDTQVRGVFFEVPNPDRPPELAVKTAKILSDAGIATHYTRTNGMGGFSLAIGPP
jgi:hypothetical protein